MPWSRCCRWWGGGRGCLWSALKAHKATTALRPVQGKGRPFTFTASRVLITSTEEMPCGFHIHFTPSKFLGRGWVIAPGFVLSTGRLRAIKLQAPGYFPGISILQSLISPYTFPSPSQPPAANTQPRVSPLVLHNCLSGPSLAQKLWQNWDCESLMPSS